MPSVTDVSMTLPDVLRTRPAPSINPLAARLMSLVALTLEPIASPVSSLTVRVPVILATSVVTSVSMLASLD